jgi:hypothetical protein
MSMKKTTPARSHPRDRTHQQRAGEGELLRIIRAIQELTLDLAQPHRRNGGPELEEKARKLEQLRWRLASVARRSATEQLSNAA